jgi:hypothetical protein
MSISVPETEDGSAEVELVLLYGYVQAPGSGETSSIYRPAGRLMRELFPIPVSPDNTR